MHAPSLIAQPLAERLILVTRDPLSAATRCGCCAPESNLATKKAPLPYSHLLGEPDSHDKHVVSCREKRTHKRTSTTRIASEFVRQQGQVD